MNIIGSKPLEKQTTIRISQEIWDWIEKLAIETRRSRGDIIRFALEHCKDENWEP